MYITVKLVKPNGENPLLVKPEDTFNPGILNLNLKNIGWIEDTGEKIDFYKLNSDEEDVIDYSRDLFKIHYRFKNVLKEKYFYFAIDNSEVSKYLAKHNFYKLERFYINIDNILFIEEEYKLSVTKDKNKVKLFFYLSDGMVLQILTTKSRWENWKHIRL